MPRIKRYIDTDVLTAARDRVAEIFDKFDTVVVSFSGGKDSLVVLDLVRAEAEQRGQVPVHAIFYDEEVIPDSVLETVDHYRNQAWCALHWFCYPLASNKFILGKSYAYTQWDPSRRWVRPKPAWALVPADGDTRVLSQYQMEQVVQTLYPGKIATLLGLRAAESLTRYSGFMTKLHKTFLNFPQGRITTGSPIYDWSENDVLKYIYEQRLVYCRTYDAQHLVGGGLRVSTPLHSEKSRQFHLLKAMEPTFYQQVVEVFPEMLAHERYWREYDGKKALEPYRGSWEGIARFVDDQFTDPQQRKLARQRLEECKRKAANRPEAFPLDYVLNYFAGGTIKRGLLPLSTKRTHAH